MAAGLLKQCGYEVDFASNWDTAVKLAVDEQYDVLLVDWDLGDSKVTGLDFFAYLGSEELQQAAEWCLVSYHFHGDIPEGTVPPNVRPLPLDSEHFQNLKAFRRGFVSRLKGSDDPVALPFSVYSSLTLDARAELAEQVGAKYAKRIAGELARKFWIVACGPKFEVVRSAERFLDVGTDDEVWELGRSMGYAPFQFFADEFVDDCATGGVLQTYPSLTFQIDDLAGGEDISIHLDTGASTTFVDAEALASPPRVPGRKRIRTSANRTHDVAGSTIWLAGAVKCQLSDESNTVRFRALAVRSWEKTSLARKCIAEQCPAPTQSGVCRYRVGLIGQSFLVETGTSVALIPDESAVRTQLL
jgi:CheY-like chemotaxis protein